MIIGAESSLRKPPKIGDQKQVRFIDAIRLTAEGVDIAYERLVDELSNFENECERRDYKVASLVLDAWSVIDSVHRLRGLVDNMPRYKGRAPSKQIFLRATKDVVDLRNSVQHLGTDIDSLAESELPVLGALTWIRPINEASGEMSVESLIPGQFYFVQPESHVQVPDTVPDRLNHIKLWASGGSADISALVVAVDRLCQSLEASLTKHMDQLPDQSRADSDIHAVIEVKLVPAEDKA